MLNWLKKKARVTLHNRYNILGRNNHPEMILTEQNMVNTQEAQVETLKLYIYNVDGDEYMLDVPLHMSIEKIKAMSVGHFFTPLEAIGMSSVDEDQDWSDGFSSCNNYRLLLTRASRTLLDENSVMREQLVNNDELVLLECRKSALNPLPPNSNAPITQDRIAQETSHLTPKNRDRNPELQIPSIDFKIALRKILLTLIEVSVHLIASEEDCFETFVHIFEQLEKKHKPRVDNNYLKQLTEMGFPEVRAMQALFLKRTVPAAMDWLLDESNFDLNELCLENMLLSLSPEQSKEYFTGEGKDPAIAVLEQFNTYSKKWFQPDAKAVQVLKNIGYGEDLAKEALRASCNNEIAARSLLEGDSAMVEEIQKGFSRDSPIMLEILESPIVQLALTKPKTLFALMVLCENPSNANVWLSDPETHPIISQVLRIYQAAKHRLCNESDASFRLLNQTHSASTDSRTDTTYLSLGNSAQNSPTISMQIETSSSRQRVGRIQGPFNSIPFPMNYFANTPSLSQSEPATVQDQASTSSAAEVTHLTLTYIPPTTEGGMPTVSLRLEGPSTSSSHLSNSDVEMSDETNNSGSQ